MSDTGTQAPPVPTAPPPVANPNAPTSDELQKLDTWARSFATKEKNEGRTSAAREIAEKLGMTPDEAVEFIKQAKEREAAGLDEATRKLNEATEKLEKAEKLEVKARERELFAEIRAELIEQGVPRAQAKVIAPSVDVDPKDWDETKVKEAVANLKGTVPQLFAEGEGDPNDDQSDGTQQLPPTGTPPPADSKVRGTPPQNPPQSATDKARARLLERHPGLKKE